MKLLFSSVLSGRFLPCLSRGILHCKGDVRGALCLTGSLLCSLFSLWVGLVLASQADLLPWRTGDHITPSSGPVHLPQKLITTEVTF